MRLFDLVCTTEWAIRDENVLRGILAFVSREDISRDALANMIGTQASLDAVQTQRGERLSYSRSMTARDGVAIIQVVGPISRYTNMLSDYSGGATVASIALDLYGALADPAIHSIMLNVDSPGGTVNGTSELASMIYKAREIKPIVAYIGFLGASAAYWIAAAASRIVANDTAIVGSIGVIVAVTDPSKEDSNEIVMVSSQSPHKLVDVSTKGGRSQIQTQLDDMAEIFIAKVAQYRGIGAARVQSDYGRGDVLIASKALSAGMIDALGSEESVIAELVADHKKKISSSFGMDAIIRSASMSETEKMAAEMTAMREKMERNDQELSRLRTEVIRKDAEAFASSLVSAHQALPAEQDAIIGMVTQAKLDDAEKPMASGSREALVRAAYASRTPHALTAELVPDRAVKSAVAAHSVAKPDNGEVSEERRQELLGMSRVGRRE